MPAHSAEGRIVEVAVGSNHPDDTLAVFLDHTFGEADELDVVIIEPMFAFLQFFFSAWFDFIHVVVSVVFVLRNSWVGWVAEHDHNRAVGFDFAR